MGNITNNTRALLPVILFSVSAIVWMILAYSKLVLWQGDHQVAGIVLVGLYMLWLLAESKVAVKEPDKGHTQRDKGTLELYAVGRIATVTAALALPTTWTSLGVWPAIGLFLSVIGIGVRLAAIRTLGKYYSHRVRRVDEHQIVDTGPYRLVRHPSYTGMLVAHAGFVIFFFHYAALALLLCFFIPALVFRILMEEQMLFEIQGYEEYAKGRSRLLPFIW